MAYFAELNSNNIVLRVVAIGDQFLLDENNVEQEEKGIEFCKQLWGEDTIWKQTSYNTYGGQHREGKTPLRKNYAAIGDTYDEQIDAFISPKPEGEGWTLDEDRGGWRNFELERLEKEREELAKQMKIGVTHVNANN